MSYLYETHLHTSQGSGCGRSTGAEHARFYKDAGYQGIIITDHFFGGNTATPRNLPWKERIDHFCAGYEDRLAEGQRIGLSVLFGWEEGFQGDEYLVYGLDKAFMLAHPEMERWTRKQQFEAVHAAGGCVIQAHPFRMREYIRAIHVADVFADGVEAFNAGNTPAQDAYAWRYAQAKGLYMTAGSDNHRSSAGCSLYGVAFSTPLADVHDWVHRVRTRAPHSLIFDERRIAADISAEPLMSPAYLLDENEQRLPLPTGWLAQ